MLVTPSMKLWLPMENSANDASGNGNNGTVVGCSLTTGKFGQCYSFDGTDDYIDLPTVIDAKGSQSMTVVAWINTTFDGSDNYIMGSGGIEGWYIRTEGDTWNDVLLVKIDDGTNYAYGLGTTKLNDGNWHMLVLQLDATNNLLKGYVDCVEEISEDSSSVGEMGNDDKLMIGSVYMPEGGYYYYSGKIDEPMIFNKALSQADIRRLYLNFHPLGG